MLEKLTTALVHTLIGMGTVFVILIVISLIISAFALIPKLEKLLHGKKEEPALPVPYPEPEIEEAQETDDLEIIAVITAAVAASMGTTSTDGFVVRSIKRRQAGPNRW